MKDNSSEVGNARFKLFEVLELFLRLNFRIGADEFLIVK